MDALRDAGFDECVRPFAVGLKRAASIDEDIGAQDVELGCDVAPAVELGRNELGLCALSRGAEGVRLRPRTAADQERQPRIVLEK